MSNHDLVRMGFGNLLRRKTRSVLTVLGVVIGTCSIVIMLSLGIAMDIGFKEQLSYMGDLTIIDIYNHGYYGGGMDASGEAKLDDQAVTKIKSIPGVAAVMPVRSMQMKMGAGRYIGYVNIIGIDPDVMDAFGFDAEEGRLLHASDKDSLVFGRQVAYNFYNPRLNQRHYYYGMDMDSPPPVDVLTAKLTMTSDMQYGETRNRWVDDSGNPPAKIHDVRGVGVLSRSNSDKDYNVYMNRSAMEKLMADERRTNRNDRGRPDQSQFERVQVKTDSMEAVESVQAAIQAMGHQTYSLTDMLKSMKETSRMIQLILGGIGAVSLLVAAIGITNTMVMSIYERTREIGVMKVIGAQLGDIRKLFLIEAGLIGFGGGLIGICFSLLISMGLNRIGMGFMGPGSTTRMSVIPLQLALMSLAFSTLIGIISGYSPARRAMKLSALEAIRND